MQPLHAMLCAHCSRPGWLATGWRWAVGRQVSDGSGVNIGTGAIHTFLEVRAGPPQYHSSSTPYARPGSSSASAAAL